MAASRAKNRGHFFQQKLQDDSRKSWYRESFEARIDGVVSEEKNIPGKPAPDIFLAAAEALGVSPSETLVVEDARPA
ncbi:MAG: HAD family hydrolase [Bacteroidia bacterium]|nr:HAD family hydrolase [Bacteroidia bacterium]